MFDFLAFMVAVIISLKMHEQDKKKDWIFFIYKSIGLIKTLTFLDIPVLNKAETAYLCRTFISSQQILSNEYLREKTSLAIMSPLKD